MHCSASELDLDAFQALHSGVKRGDIVGATGFPGKSKRGELSIFATKFVVLAPCLHMLPKAKLTNQVSSSSECHFFQPAAWSRLPTCSWEHFFLRVSVLFAS